MPPFPKEKKVRPVFKLWFEIGDKYVFGEGTYNLLNEIQRKKSITAAANSTNMSYRHAWGLIKEIELHLKTQVVKSQKGGKHGGKSELTKMGLSLLQDYKKLRKRMDEVCKL